MLTSSPDGLPVLESKNVVRRRFVMTLGIAAIIGLIALLMTGGQGSSDRVIGSGSTFAQPLVERSAVLFQDDRAGDGDWVGGSTGIDYEPVGSLGGVMRLQDAEVDFAITDYPLSRATLEKYGAAQFPIVIGSISAVYNLKDAGAAPLRLSGSTLAGIFGGRIKAWSDPAIKADNPTASLPDTPITVVYRQDGSGSTFNWSNYLAANDDGWRARFGVGTAVKWPGGKGAKGGKGMAEAVARTDGAIGYLETGQARRAKLRIAQLKNASGQFVEATEAEVALGARGSGTIEGTGAPEQAVQAAGYPVVTASYVVMKRQNRSSADNDRALRFFGFMLGHASAEARALGYLPLSPQQVAQVRGLWSREFNFADGASVASR